MYAVHETCNLAHLSSHGGNPEYNSIALPLSIHPHATLYKLTSQWVYAGQ